MTNSTHKFILIFSVVSYLLSCGLSYAGIHGKAGTAGAAFLKIGIGARPIGMGGAFVAVADDANTLYWNPAGLVNISRPEITVTHNEWFESIKYEFIGYSHPTEKWGNFGIGLYLLHMAKIARTKEDAQGLYAGEEGTFKASDKAFVLAYGREINDDISVGVNLKIIQQVNADVKGKGIAVDLGCLYNLPVRNLIAGLNVQNIGPAIKINGENFALPINVKLGCSYRVNQRLLLAMDLNQPIDNYLSASMGGEFWFRNMFAVRLGYRYKLKGNDLGFLSGLRAGCGFKWQILQLDYAWVPYGDLGNTHRISINVRF